MKKKYGILRADYVRIAGRDPNPLDWAFAPGDKLERARNRTPGQKQRYGHARAVKEKLPAGALLTVFNTISKGAIVWQGTIRLLPPRKGETQDFQAKTPREEWLSLFQLGYPAKLERGGKTVCGALHPFYEQGMSAMAWAVQEYGVAGYPGLHCLQNGDKLTVYKKVTDGNIEWQGRLAFGPEGEIDDGRIPRGQTLRTPLHMDGGRWSQLFQENRPVRIEP